MVIKKEELEKQVEPCRCGKGTVTTIKTRVFVIPGNPYTDLMRVVQCPDCQPGQRR